MKLYGTVAGKIPTHRNHKGEFSVFKQNNYYFTNDQSNSERPWR